VQNGVIERNAGLPSERRIEFRLGGEQRRFRAPSSLPALRAEACSNEDMSSGDSPRQIRPKVWEDP
jgi:hypothetical protein